MDHTTLAAVGDSALGLHVSGSWNTDLDNPTNRQFVTNFIKAYGRTPTMYAAQGYDTALAIASALNATGGRVDDAPAFRKAMLAADFKSTRGNFKFGSNQHPIQDWWAMTVEKDDRGAVLLKTRRKILSSQSDPYASQCKM